jgi:hypothetical protein
LGFLTDHLTWVIAAVLVIAAIIIAPRTRQELLMSSGKPRRWMRWHESLFWVRRRRAREAEMRETTDWLDAITDTAPLTAPPPRPPGGRHRRGSGVHSTVPLRAPAALPAGPEDPAWYQSVNVRPFRPDQDGAGLANGMLSAPVAEPEYPTIVGIMLDKTRPAMEEYLQSLPRYAGR